MSVRNGSRDDLMRVVRHEQGRPDHRGRIHLVSKAEYAEDRMVSTLCALDMWVIEASKHDLERLSACSICAAVPAVRAISERILL